MNPSIILGVCAGMVLYAVLKTLVGGRKSTPTSDCAGKVLPLAAKEKESSAVRSEPSPERPEVLDPAGHAVHEKSGKEAEASAAPELPADRVRPNSSLSVTFSGEKRKQWFLVKSSTGAVKVCQALERTPKTIAGPFATKEEAYRAKKS